MKKLNYLVMFLMIMGPITVLNADEYKEKDGLVVMEFENAGKTSGWKLDTSIKGYTGKGALTAKGGRMSGGGKGTITFTFTITKPGKYSLQTRMRAGDNSHKLNDCWVKFVNGKPLKHASGKYHALRKSKWYKLYESEKRIWPNWGWSGVLDTDGSGYPYVEYDKPGTYKIQYSIRSDKFSIDRLVLSHESIDAKKKPRDLSLPETK